MEAIHTWANRPAYYRLLASFLAMLILPFATLFFNYFYAQKLLRQENLSYQNALLVQAQMSVDEKLENLQLFALNITNDRTISNFLSEEELSGSELQIRIWELSQYLQRHAAIYHDLCQLYLYSSRYDYLIGASAADSGVSRQVIRLKSDALNAQLQGLLQKPGQFCRYSVLRDGTSSELVLANSTPMWKRGQDEDGTICLLVDTKGLFRGISEMQELQAGLVCLVDENGEVIVGTGDQTLQEFLPRIDGMSDDFLNLPDGRYTVSAVSSRINEWRYLSIQPEHAVMPRLQVTRNLSLGVFAAILLFGVGGAYYFSRRNYRPIESLMEVLRRQAGVLREQANADESEFSLIERSVQDISDSMKLMRTMVQDELPHIQEGLLQQLLSNAVNDYSSFREILTNIGIILPYQRFAVAVIRQSDQDIPEEQALVNVIAKEQLVRLTPLEIAYTTATQADMLVIVFNSDADDFEQECAKILRGLAQNMRSEFSRMVTICLSRVMGGIERVSYAYYMAVQNQTALPGEEVILLSEQSPIRSERRLDELATPLKNHIATGNVEKALALLHENYQNNIENKNLPLYTLRGYYAGLLNIITSVDVTAGSMLTPDGEDPMAQLFAQHTADEMQNTIETVIVSLCAVVQNSQRSHAVQLTDQILEFLQQEYSNSELTLSYTADRFYITASYLSTFFKENVGDTFLNYLTRLRIERAKELIRTTELPMVRIASEVGYASGNTFTRIFKKIEGITPSQFRDSLSK